MNTLKAVGFAAAVLLPLVAAASTVSETDAFSIDTTVSPTSSPDSLSFAQFNAALGTLTGVSIELTGQANAVYSVVTNSTSSFTTTGSASTTLQVSGVGFTAVSSPTLAAGVTDGTVNASSSSSTFTHFPGTASSVDLLASVASGSLRRNLHLHAGPIARVAAIDPLRHRRARRSRPPPARVRAGLTWSS
jgi:hypothetical protein